MTRQQANYQILSKLRQFFESNPDMRFFQALHCLGMQKAKDVYLVDYAKDSYTPWQQLMIEDNFHEESEKTLRKIK